MKKVFILEDLDCAHCAEKIETSIGKLEGVQQCRVTFLTCKMTLDMEDDKVERIIKEAKKIIKTLEPDVSLIEK
ncbi:MAG: cation transporter [Lachnospiraceae bacterium]